MPWSESNGEAGLGWVGGSRRHKQARSIYHISLGASIFIFVYVCATARKGRRAYWARSSRVTSNEMEKRSVRSVNMVTDCCCTKVQAKQSSAPEFGRAGDLPMI